MYIAPKDIHLLWVLTLNRTMEGKQEEIWRIIFMPSSG